MTNKTDNINSHKSLLSHNMQKFWQQIHAHEINTTLESFHVWQQASHNHKETNTQQSENRTTSIQQLCRFISQQIEHCHQQILALHERYGTFSSQTQRSATEDEQWQHQIAFLEYMGYTKNQIHKDQQAKKRWFGNDAIKDRYQNKTAKNEHTLCFLLERLGQLIQLMASECQPVDTQKLIQALKLEVLLTPLLQYENDDRVAFEAVRCLRVAFDRQSKEMIEELAPLLTPLVYRLASEPNQPVWVQTESLALLFSFGLDSANRLLQHRLEKHSELSVDIFFRARALIVILDYQASITPSKLAKLINLIMLDSSIYVRQQLCEKLPELPQDLRFNIFSTITKKDDAHQVRAKAWLSLEPLLKACFIDNLGKNLKPPLPLNEQIIKYLKRYIDSLKYETDALMLRLLMDICVPILKVIKKNNSYQQKDFYTQCHERLTTLHTNHEETRVRRWAAVAREQLWQCRQPPLESLNLHTLNELSLAQVKSIKRPNMGNAELGRHLAALSKQGFGFDVSSKKNKLTVRGGYTLHFRLWRVLHEWRHPQTDKRQNYNHTQGRVFYGNLQVPAQLLAESSETKVPGEPVINEQEQGWRPFLPLVDQVLSSLDQGWPTRAVKLYTSEGITKISPPNNLFKRLWAKLYISFHFKRFSILRNWQEHDETPAHSYLQAFMHLGFTFSHQPYQEHETPLPIDSRVAKFFPSFLPFYSLTEFWRELQNYFYSVYQNTLEQLTLFLFTITALFFGQHFWLNQQFRKARELIPFVIGGWGTRGKSGTERLKAALFNAHGISLVSKSTGCEAQFLYAPLHRPLKELFLFRPFDKASIWEQLHLTRLAAKLKVNILLWECMGLTPRYISILQQQWMQDDLATITNCYPDHEDIQGPSGIDIPKVMMRFVPKNATFITSEDTMSPLLESAARDNNSHYHHVNWHDGYLIAPEILARFPYEEHPTNIALVLKMAEVLGFDKDMAIKAMADNVVPDLGVLRVYPQSCVQRRKLIFINGMSANERLAALSNWHRLQLDKITPNQNPETWLTTVVNNRADRIARSQVFAKMLVNDLSSDMHFLIGTNVDGLLKYIESNWQERIDNLNLTAYSAQISNSNPDNKSKGGNSRELLNQKFVQICEYIRIPTDIHLPQLRIQAMLTGLELAQAQEISTLWQSKDQFISRLAQLKIEDQEAIIRYSEQAEQELLTYQQWYQCIMNTDKTIDFQKLRDQLWQWYRQRLVVIDDVHASGNILIRHMIQKTPPGLCNKMIGLQNIKGTGLDFIYRWQNWDTTYKLCQTMNGRMPVLAEGAAKALSNITDFGLLDEELVIKTCDVVRTHKFAQTEIFQAEINHIEANVKQQLKEISKSFNIQNHNSFFDKFIAGVEEFFDAGKSVTRRKISEKIYQDLSDQRISLERATYELQNINKEQKGGWLSQIIKKRFGSTNNQ